jgi:type I restriction enzyme, S subunit
VEVISAFKQTEVGVIPKDWEVKPLGEIGDVRMCKRVLKHQTRQHGDVPFYKIGTFGGVADAFISRSLFDEFRRKYSFPKKGDVLISAAGTIGRTVVYDGAPAYFQDSNIVWIENDESTTTNAYLWHRYKVTKWAVSHGGTVARLYNDSLRTKIFVPIPPLSEQRNIAAVLGDVNVLLCGLDRLIAKKRDLKQAAMQQLLTGRTRMPGFHERWEVKRVGDLGSFLKGSGVKKEEARSGDLPCIRYGEIYTHHHDCVRSFNSWISREVADMATPLRQGDILFAGSGETKEEIGKCVAFVDDIEAYAGGDIVILRPTDAHAQFLGYLLNAPAVASQKASRGQGDAVVHISASALASIDLSLPSSAEQAAIAAVLSDMDAEISALEARRVKTLALKQAMMQELLTGRIRLVTGRGADA